MIFEDFKTSKMSLRSHKQRRRAAAPQPAVDRFLLLNILDDFANNILILPQSQSLSSPPDDSKSKPPLVLKDLSLLLDAYRITEQSSSALKLLRRMIDNHTINQGHDKHDNINKDNFLP